MLPRTCCSSRCWACRYLLSEIESLMETLTNLAYGFEQIMTVQALLICLLGVTLGTFIGVLPGIGALTTISLCLPLTFHLDLLILFAPMLANVAISFSAADYFSIMLLALTAASTLGVGSPLKGLAMVV